MERHALEVFCLTWNVNEARPESGNALYRWVLDLSQEAGLLVVALQEIESGGSSLALAAAKDALLTRQQVERLARFLILEQGPGSIPLRS